MFHRTERRRAERFRPILRKECFMKLNVLRHGRKFGFLVCVFKIKGLIFERINSKLLDVLLVISHEEFLEDLAENWIIERLIKNKRGLKSLNMLCMLRKLL